MNQPPLISVVIPIYNTERYLNKCIESVLCQTYHELEIILVDDGSTDRSSQICDEIQKKDQRIKVIHQKNGGAADARNAGLRVASGQYISFVDSDDYLDFRMYEILYHKIKENHADIVCCGIMMETEDARYLTGTKRHSPWLLTSSSALKHCYQSKSALCGSCNRLFAAGTIKTICFDVSLDIGEDALFSTQAFLRSKLVVCISDPLYHVVHRKCSLSHSLQVSEKSLSEITAWEKIIKLHQDYNIPEISGAKNKYIKANIKWIEFNSSNRTSFDESVHQILKGNIERYIHDHGISHFLKLEYLLVCISPVLHKGVHKIAHDFMQKLDAVLNLPLIIKSKYM